MITFKVQINGGEVHTLEFETGLYGEAANAALSMVAYPKQDHQLIKIWADCVLPDYGPYIYANDGTATVAAIDAPEWMVQDPAMRARLLKAPAWLNAHPSIWAGNEPEYLMVLQ